MNEMHAIQVPSRLVGLRLFVRRGPGGTPSSPRAQQLLDLEQRSQKRAADDEALRRLVESARQHAEQIPGVVQARLEEVAGIAVELGLAIARELVGAALDKGLVDPTPTVVRCLADCVHGSDRGDLVVRLNPADVAAVKTRLSGMPELADEIARAKFVPDGNLPRGAVRAETGAGRLRYDPNDVLERICAEVRREANG